MLLKEYLPSNNLSLAILLCGEPIDESLYTIRGCFQMLLFVGSSPVTDYPIIVCQNRIHDNNETCCSFEVFSFDIAELSHPRSSHVSCRLNQERWRFLLVFVSWTSVSLRLCSTKNYRCWQFIYPATFSTPSSLMNRGVEFFAQTFLHFASTYFQFFVRLVLIELIHCVGQVIHQIYVRRECVCTRKTLTAIEIAFQDRTGCTKSMSEQAIQNRRQKTV